jgi:hypothetical protein
LIYFIKSAGFKHFFNPKDKTVIQKINQQQCETVGLHNYPSLDEVALATAGWMIYYNNYRIKKLGRMSPV